MTALSSAEPPAGQIAYRALAGRSRQALLNALITAGRPMDAGEAARAVGLHRNTARAQLDILVSAGLLSRSARKDGQRGRPRVLYMPAASADGVLAARDHFAAPRAMPVPDAVSLILAEVERLPARTMRLAEASGHVLAQSVIAADDVPRFANSAMDGYAVRAADTASAPVRLDVVETISAGEQPRYAVPPGGAAKIMTGAPMPDGADAVCMIERTTVLPDGLGVLIASPVAPGSNVRLPGEDIEAGSIVFDESTLLGPAHVGVLASLGIDAVAAYPRPVVAVMSTGNELAADDSAPRPGQIRDANRPALLTRVAADGLVAADLGIVPDDETALAGELLRAARRCDVIIATGGVSVGDHDVLKVVMARLGGASMHGLDVAIKPGRHVAIARLRDSGSLVFGLPGNPVAALVGYEIFVRPALRAMAGHRVLSRPRLSAIAEVSLRRRPGPKLHLVRVRARCDAEGNLRVHPSGGQDSHMLRAMAAANALALLPDGDGVPAGERVEVLLLDDGEI
jgi:molybdopterin molybdotransferase